MAIFDILRWRPPPSWIFKIKIFNGRTRHECQTVSPCQISWPSVKLLPRCRNFWIFQDGGRPQCILEMLDGLSESGRVYLLEFLCVTRSTAVFRQPAKSTWWSLSLCKYGWNWSCSFEDMWVLILSEFGLIMPIHSTFGVFWGAHSPECHSSS